MAVRHAVAFEELVDYAEGRLETGETLRVSEHIKGGCPQCVRDVQWLEHVLGLVAADRLVEAPPALVRRAQGQFRPPRRRAVPVLAGLPAWLRSQARWRYATAIALASLLILAATWWAWGGTSVAQAATLAGLEGPVEVRLAGVAEWQPATPGMLLGAGSALRSGLGATALLTYPDGSRTSLTENTEVEIVSLSSRRDGCALNVRLHQSSGHTQLELATACSSARVETDEGVAEANAGDYEVSVTDAGVEVYAGRAKVKVRTAGKEALLAAGERGRIKQGRLVVATPVPDDDDEHPEADTPEPKKGRGSSESPSSRKGAPGQRKLRLTATPAGDDEGAEAEPVDATEAPKTATPAMRPTARPEGNRPAPSKKPERNQEGRQRRERAAWPPFRGRARHLPTPTPTPPGP